jgi:asparagine synthase (glutamine-hydrolysing)
MTNDNLSLTYNQIGDILLNLNIDQSPVISRVDHSNWYQVEKVPNWSLWFHPPGNHWKGFPLNFIQERNWKIWLLGELYGISASPDVSGNLLKDVVLGRKSASQLNGHFLLLAWDTLEEKWHAWTSRFGTLHAYHATNGQGTALGTFFPAVAGAASRRRLDWLGLSGFFAFGFFPQDRTYYEDVRILQPASHYLFDASGGLLSHEPYWQWWHKPETVRTYRDTVAEFAQIFQGVMAEHLQGGRIAIPISGGLDSRSTVAAITQPGGLSGGSPGLWAFSYGYSENSIETRIARQVADKRGLPFKAFTIKPYLFDCLDWVMSSLEGFQDVTQCRQAAVAEEISPRADSVIAAHWGDVWLDDMGLSGKPKREGLDEEQLLNFAFQKVEKGRNNWLLKHLCHQQTGGVALRDCLREMVRQEIAHVGHIEDQDFRLKAFKTNQWSFRWTEASLRMYQPGAFPRLPFYDTRLSDFFGTVPTEFVRARRLQIDYLKNFAPDLARIRWQAFDTNLFRQHQFHTWLLPKRALKKAWRKLTRQQVIERNWEVQFLCEEGRQGLNRWLLQPGLRLHEFVSRHELQTLIQDFYENPIGAQGYTVSMLLTFSAWLERYG